MDDGYPPYGIMVYLILLILEAIFFGFGAAIQNINTAALEKEAQEGDKRAAKLLAVAERPAKFINTIQLVVHGSGMAVGACVLAGLGRRLAARWLPGVSAARDFGIWCRIAAVVAVTAALLLIVTVALGIIIPKRYAARKPEAWCRRLYPAVGAVMFLLTPLSTANTFIARGILRLLRTDMDMDGDNVTEEDIMSMVNEGHEQGVLEASEAEMITNIFQMGDKDAGDIMTHRKNLVAIDAEMSLKDAIDFILTEGTNSRYPVYRRDVDDIIGILHMKDAMIFAEKQGRLAQPVGSIPGLLREAHFIPETRRLDSLFKEMQSRKVHMAVVVDEYGQTSGIVTMEDILEEIVGNILDEYDDEEEEYITETDGGFLISGMAPLDQVGEALGIRFPEEDLDSFDTINGFLISRLNRIPREDEKPQVDALGYRFEIESMESKIIRTVKAVPLPREAGEKEEAENDPE